MTGTELARIGCPYLGVPYSKMDCQAFVEKCLSDLGIRKDLSGSNAWYRFLLNNGWIGSPEECKKKFGSIPPGAFLFIHSFDGGEEKRGYHDGLGNASHIGIYTGLTGKQMVRIAEDAGNASAGQYNFGDGAINSSSTRKAVATSKFAGKSIRGGWNKVGLWGRISYGEKIDQKLGKSEDVSMIATTYSDKGKTINLRTKPSTGSALADQIPIGSQVEILERGSDWCKCRWKSETGYIMTKFLIFGEYVPGDSDPTPAPDGTITVSRVELKRAYDIIGNLLGVRG